jgi:hypothetical protein
MENVRWDLIEKTIAPSQGVTLTEEEANILRAHFDGACHKGFKLIPEEVERWAQ